jgi:hypothetical protein
VRGGFSGSRLTRQSLPHQMLGDIINVNPTVTDFEYWLRAAHAVEFPKGVPLPV